MLYLFNCCYFISFLNDVYFKEILIIIIIQGFLKLLNFKNYFIFACHQVSSFFNININFIFFTFVIIYFYI